METENGVRTARKDDRRLPEVPTDDCVDAHLVCGCGLTGAAPEGRPLFEGRGSAMKGEVGVSLAEGGGGVREKGSIGRTVHQSL